MSTVTFRRFDSKTVLPVGICRSATDNLMGAHFCAIWSSRIIQFWRQFSIGPTAYAYCTCSPRKYKRYPSTNHAARTCLSHQRMSLIGVGRLVTIAYVDPAHCRCRQITDHRLHRLVTYPRVPRYISFRMRNTIVFLMPFRICYRQPSQRSRFTMKVYKFWGFFKQHFGRY